MKKTTLVLMAGPPGSGKTSLALALSKTLRWPTVDKDTLKSPMLTNGVPEEIAGRSSYDLMFEVGRDLMLRQGFSVILDSPAGYSLVVERAQRLADEARAHLRFVLCLASHRVRRKRMAERAPMPSQWTSDDTILDDGTERWVPLMPASSLVVYTDSPVEDLLAEVISYIHAG